MSGGVTQTAGGPRERADRWLVAALLVSAAAGAAVVLWIWGRSITFSSPLDYGEGPLLDHALRLARGEQLYAVPGAEPPWTVLNYPPVYPALNAVASLLAGPGYWYGRLLSALGALTAAVFAGLIVHRITGDRAAAAITALLMSAIPYLGYWAALARVDAVALGLSLAGLYCVVRGPDSVRWLVVAVALLVASIHTRQTYLLVAPLTAVVWLWPYGRRRVLVFAAALGGTVGVIGVVINAATAGSFWFNVVTANVNAYDWSLLAWYAEDVVRTLPVLLIGLVASVVLLVRERRPSARIVVPYAAAALVVALTAGKSGSSLNYLVELGTACCLAAGFLLADLRSRPRWRVAALAALLVQTLGLAVFPYPYYADLLHAASDRGTAEQIAAAVATSPGPVLADEDSGYLPLRNRPIELQPFELSQLSYGGLWDQQPLLTSIRQHRYAVILVYETDQTPSAEEYRWTPEMLAAIRQSYLIDARIERPLGRTVVYRPAR